MTSILPVLSFLVAVHVQQPTAPQPSPSQGWYAVSSDEAAYRELSQLKTWKERDAKAKELGLIRWDGFCRYYISPALTGDLGLQLHTRLLDFLTNSPSWDKPVTKGTHDPSEFSAYRSIFQRAFGARFTTEPGWEEDLAIAPQINFRALKPNSRFGNSVSVLLKGPIVSSGGSSVPRKLAFDAKGALNIETMQEALVLRPGFCLLGEGTNQGGSFAVTVLGEVAAELRKRQCENREKMTKQQAELLARFAGETAKVNRDSKVSELPTDIQEKLRQRGLDSDTKLTDCRVVFSLNFRLKNADGTFTDVSFTPLMGL